MEEKKYKQNRPKTAGSGRCNCQILEINGCLRQENVEEKIYKQNRPKTAGSERHNYQMLDINGNLDRNENQSNRIVEEKM